MFENFTKFFANKKHIHAFIAALVILTGILVLKRAGLYEGMHEGLENGVVATTHLEKKPSKLSVMQIS